MNREGYFYLFIFCMLNTLQWYDLQALKQRAAEVEDCAKCIGALRRMQRHCKLPAGYNVLKRLIFFFLEAESILENQDKCCPNTAVDVGY